MPSEEAIAALALDPAKPILEKVSRGFLKDGRVFEYSRNVFNTDDYKFTLVAKVSVWVTQARLSPVVKVRLMRNSQRWKPQA